MDNNGKVGYEEEKVDEGRRATDKVVIQSYIISI